MKKVIVLSTGGTIASTAGADGRSVAGALPGERLIPHIQLHPDIDLRVRSIFQKPSNAITSDNLCELYRQCQDLIDAGHVTGIVITHGTDTLEDTAYFLETTLSLKKTAVVVTGSQRVPHAMGTDAYVNLQNAVHIAAHHASHTMGVLVAFNENIFSAGTVRKVSSYQLNGFDSPGLGSLGLIDNGDVSFYQRPLRLPVLPLPRDTAELPAVDLVAASLGARAVQLDAAVQADARGIVIDALGRGQVPRSWIPSVQRACEAGIPVLICSSTLHGPVHQSYDYPGSLHDLESTGAIGISLPARKARMRLAVHLASGSNSPASIRQAFTRGLAPAHDERPLGH